MAVRERTYCDRGSPPAAGIRVHRQVSSIIRLDEAGVDLYPGWDSFGTMISHLRFVRDHHRSVKRVALASDSAMAKIMPKLVDHFVGAEVKGFAYDERDKALAWLKRTG